MKQMIPKYTVDLADVKFVSSVNYKPLGRLPRWAREGVENKKVKRINRYLKYQEKRLISMTNSGENERVVWLWCMLLKNSLSYQITLMTKVVPNWYYFYGTEKWEMMFVRFVNKVRRWNLDLKLERFYLPKPNGKLRPIGSPDINSKAISKSISDLNYLLLFKDNEVNHAYSQKRGVSSALMEIIHKINAGNNKVYEFDLKSFFNTISWSYLYRILRNESEFLANVNMTIIKNCKYSWKELKTEKELQHLQYFFNKVRGGLKRVQHYGRQGLPQGLNMSPLLSIFGLNRLPLKGLVMYADDGVYLYKDNKNEFYIWLTKMFGLGIKIAPEKSRDVTNQFEFVGFKLNLKNKWIMTDNPEMLAKGQGTKKFWGLNPGSDEEAELIAWINKCSSSKYKPEKSWKWDITENSYITKEAPGISVLKLGWEKVFDVVKNIITTDKVYKGYAWWLGKGCFDVQGSSGLCAERFIINAKTLIYKKKLKLDLKPQQWKRYYVTKYEHYLEDDRISNVDF